MAPDKSIGKHCAFLQDEILSFVTIWIDPEDIMLGVEQADTSQELIHKRHLEKVTSQE